jgi:hypothetical protein
MYRQLSVLGVGFAQDRVFFPKNLVFSGTPRARQQGMFANGLGASAIQMYVTLVVLFNAGHVNGESHNSVCTYIAARLQRR